MSAFDGEFNRWTQHYSAGALWRSAGTILRLSVNIAVVQVHERLFAAVFGDVESKHAIGAGRPFEHFREVFAQNVSVFVAAGPPVLQAARKAGGTGTPPASRIQAAISPVSSWIFRTSPRSDHLSGIKRGSTRGQWHDQIKRWSQRADALYGRTRL
jgi:hypothetical protein